MEVTNLNDSGTGSLRACVQASGPRTCVFRVSGDIKLTSTLAVRNPFLTVAGQTSPGGGIQLSGLALTYGMGVQISAHDVIWQYTRVRNGYSSSCASSVCGTNIMVVNSAYNVMIDHNTSQWNIDEGIAVWNNSGDRVNDITISWNLIAEGLGAHATGMVTGSATNAPSNLQTNVDFHHNLVMNNSHRNPLLKNKSTRYVNNLHYNANYYMNSFVDGVSADVIGNLYKKGPMTASSTYEVQG